MINDGSCGDRIVKAPAGRHRPLSVLDRPAQLLGERADGRCEMGDVTSSGGGRGERLVDFAAAAEIGVS